MHLTQRFKWVLTLAVALLAAASCSSGNSSSPTAPSGRLLLTNADLIVAGESMDNRTVPVGHGQGEPALFMAELMVDGAPGIGHEVWVEVDRPMGMMGPRRFPLHDDGTHGDPIAHDGLYHFEDIEGRYACNGPGMMAGEYHYEYHGETAAGQQSNRLRVRVTIEAG